MHYHIILTEKCNSECRYCYGKSMKEFENSLGDKFEFDYSDPCMSQADVGKLKEFLKKDDVLVFYGGEPLVNLEKLKEIMDSISVQFRMQTNGLLLDKLEIKYLKKIGKILVSLDGNKERTDFNRGKGNYERVLSNLKKIRADGYSGEIIGRMTISQDFPDVYEQVLNLVELIDQGILDSIHFQLDVGFYEGDYCKKKIENFFEEYNKSLKKLIGWWIGKIRESKVYKIYPFVGIVNPLLKGVKDCGLRCGAGHAGYAITTSGKVVACPIMNSIENFKAGDLSSGSLKKFDCKEECGNCEVYGLCGGRCMYWRKAKLWPKEGDEMICNSIREYINCLNGKLEEIRELIEKGVVREEDFEFEEFFGPEIIP
jgi:uncharacterized protein